MTQSPQKIYLDIEGPVILEQFKHKFVLSNDERNLFIINSDVTIIREYVITKRYEPKRGEPVELYGKYLNGAQKVLVDNTDKPRICQVKFR